MHSKSKPKKPTKPAPKPSPSKTPTKPKKKPDAAKARDSRLRSLFNLTSTEYDQVLEAQDGRCYITGKLPKNLPLFVDHDHKTGEVRGLLSAWANKGLAVFQDNPEWLRRAAEYLENPPVSRVLGEPVYGVVGRVSRKVSRRRYGPDGSKEPKPRTTGPLAKPNLE